MVGTGRGTAAAARPWAQLPVHDRTHRQAHPWRCQSPFQLASQLSWGHGWHVFRNVIGAGLAVLGPVSRRVTLWQRRAVWWLLTLAGSGVIRRGQRRSPSFSFSVCVWDIVILKLGLLHRLPACVEKERERLTSTYGAACHPLDFAEGSASVIATFHHRVQMGLFGGLMLRLPRQNRNQSNVQKVHIQNRAPRRGTLVCPRCRKVELNWLMADSCGMKTKCMRGLGCQAGSWPAGFKAKRPLRGMQLRSQLASLRIKTTPASARLK